MKQHQHISFISIALFATCAWARPQDATKPAASPAATTHANVTVVKSEISPNDGHGTYQYDIELSDGTKLVQMGATHPPPAGGNESILVVQGMYSYVDPNGKTISIKYIADDKGFQATGDAIPTSPPNPNAGSSKATAPAAAAAPVPAAPAASAAPAAAAAVVVENETPLETQASSIASGPSATI